MYHISYRLVNLCTDISINKVANPFAVDFGVTLVILTRVGRGILIMEALTPTVSLNLLEPSMSNRMPLMLCAALFTFLKHTCSSIRQDCIRKIFFIFIVVYFVHGP